MEGKEREDSFQKSGDGVSGAMMTSSLEMDAPAKKLIRQLDFNVGSGGQAAVVPAKVSASPMNHQHNPPRAAATSANVGVPSPSGTSMLHSANIQLPVRPVV